MALAKKDMADLPSGHKRMKQGDIIAIKPADWKWGTEEVKHYLLIEIDLGDGIATWEDAQKLTVPQFETGELWYPEEMPKIIGKRRYKISLNDLAVKAQQSGVIVDIEKLPESDYQPFRGKIVPFADMIQDKILGKKLDRNKLREIGRAGE